MKTIALLSLLAGMVCLPSHAEDPTPEPEPQTPPVTASTWLELQRSGSQASSNAQTLSAPVLNKIYTRYVDSFGRPIPETFKHESAQP